MSKDETPRNAPATALNDKALGRLYAIKGAVQVERNRYMVVGVSLAAAVVSLALAISALAPLKSVKPYMIEVDNIGRTQANPVGVGDYKPSEAQLRYFLAEWVYQLMTVRLGVTPGNLTRAYDKTLGAAVEQFKSHIESYRAIDRSVEFPEDFTDVKIKAINFLPEKNALIQFQLIEFSKTAGKLVKDYSITINYDNLTPQTEEQILRNPTGLVVKSFSLTKEMIK